jgi:methylglutaconyl-CoA hydratase
VAIIRLNRPERRNALNGGMIGELFKAFDFAEGSGARCVILTGNGGAFCSGADLDYIGEISKLDMNENYIDAGRLADLYLKIFKFPAPVIAMVNGFALAGGCGLASVCDFIIASRERAKFGYPEVKIGFIPAIVMVFLLRRVPAGRARELLMRGNVIDADEALKIGLINYVVPHNELENFTFKFADELISGTSPTAIRFVKEMINNILFMNLEDAIEYAISMNSISRVTEDCRRGINAFLNKEKIRW